MKDVSEYKSLNFKNMVEMTKTACFLTPILEMNLSPYADSYIGTYLGDASQEGEPIWGEEIYLVYSKKPDELDAYLRSLPSFKRSYTSMVGDVLYAFGISEEMKEKVVKPFMEGKYSAVDRSYVEKNFPASPTHKLYGNRLVFDRSPILRKMWEEKIGVELDEEAEVWSKPKPELETYGFKLDEPFRTVPEMAF